LLVHHWIAEYFHLLLAWLVVLAIGLAIPLPDDPIEYDSDFLARGFRIDRPCDERGCDFLVEIHGHDESAQGEHEGEQTADVLTLLSGAPFLGGSQESHVLHALLHLKAEIL
jgi:hypothetical protein